MPSASSARRVLPASEANADGLADGAPARRPASPHRSSLRTSGSSRSIRASTPEPIARRASFRDQSPGRAREASVADVLTFELDDEEKRDKKMAAAPSLAKAEEVYSGQDSTPGSPPPAAVGGLPAGWEQRVSKSTGDTYYVNAVTQESMFERPQFPVLPPGWTHNTSRTSGDVYYVDPQGASSYDAPVGAGKPFKPPDTKQGQAPEPEPEPEPEPLTSMVEIDDMIEVSGGYDPTDRQTSMGDHPGPDRPGWSISSNTPRTQAALDISRNKWEKIDDMRVSIGGLADIVSQARGDVHVVIASCPGVHMDAAVGICGDNRNVSTQATYLLLVVIPGLF
jgi:hypothetical protein